MIEHRLIERMISVIREKLQTVESTQKIDPVFVDKAVDFIRTYADRTHHGKEEDILFQKLKERDIQEKDQALMQELENEHVFGRKTTASLVGANTRYKNADASALQDIRKNLETLIDFYPEHIEKEDKIFFPNAFSYFTTEEDQEMLSEFYSFDRKMIHEKYDSLVKELES